MLRNQFETHSQETLDYLRATKQKIMAEQSQGVLQQVPKIHKKRSQFAALKELSLPQYGKTKIYQ